MADPAYIPRHPLPFGKILPILCRLPVHSSLPTATRSRLPQVTALHAVMAVLVALLVAGTTPVGGAAQARAAAAVYLLDGCAQQTFVQHPGPGPDAPDAPALSAATLTRVSIQLARADERSGWRSALPPPARA